MKTQDVTSQADAQKKISDIKVVGNTDTFQLLCKASSESQGWMKSTKAMQTPGGCLVQSSTQQRNENGSYAVAEALAFVPGVAIAQDLNGGRRLAQPAEEWHMLDSIRLGTKLTELLAATSVDGIGVIARWTLRDDGKWDVSAMDTEGDHGMQPVTEFGDEEAIPAEPPACFR